MQKILFVVNYLSGTVSKYNIPKLIELNLDLEKYSYDIFYIDHRTRQEEYLELFENSYEIIVSVGGDGTLLEIGQNLINKSTKLAIIPIGSGNGLATHIGYKPRDIDGAFDALNSGKTKKIDVAKIGDGYFFSNFGYGMDAKIAKDFKTKKNRGFWVYSWLTIKNFLNLKTKKVTYTLNGNTHTVESYLFNIFNSNLFGYNVGLLPWASAEDGKLDLVYLEKFPIWKLPYISLCILLKKPQWVKEMKFSTCTEITIHFNKKKLKYQVDGDPKIAKTDLKIQVLPSALYVIYP